MEHPVRVAFCPLCFAANGGSFNSSGMPLITEVDSNGMSVRGSCTRAWDCGTCSHMHEWLQRFESEGWAVSWECVDCLKKTRGQDEGRGGRLLPGFYQSGRTPRSPDDPDFDRDKPALSGCMRCGFESSFLQLVLRKV